MSEITRYGFLRAPVEACGILLPTPRGRGPETQVVEIPNRALEGNSSYKMETSDIMLVLEEWSKAATPEELNAVAVWHTHPGGNVGPSAGDMQSRIPAAAYLVVALDKDSGLGTPAWF